MDNRLEVLKKQLEVLISENNDLQELKNENDKLKEKLSRYTKPERGKKYYQKHREEILQKKKVEYSEKKKKENEQKEQKTT